MMSAPDPGQRRLSADNAEPGLRPEAHYKLNSDDRFFEMRSNVRSFDFSASHE